VLFDQPDRVLIERRTSDLDAGRGTEPVQDTRPPFTLPLLRVDDERVLVPAFVTAEPDLRQDYFLFGVFGLAAALFLAATFGLAFTAGSLAFASAGFVLAAAAVARLVSAAWERWTRVKRV
jgi:hypothetical protein